MRCRLMTYAPIGWCAFFAALAIFSPVVQAATLPFLSAEPAAVSGEMVLTMGEKETFPQLPPPPPASAREQRAPRISSDNEPGSNPYEDESALGDHLHGEELHHAIPPEELLKIRAAAESGDATAQGMLGELYHEGKGVERDLRKAFYWFRLGAEKEDSTSILYLGRYFKGEFPELKIGKDLDEAEKWLLKLAKKGDAPAMGVLGALLFERVRNGEEHRKEEATWWYNRATGGMWDENYVPPSLRSEEDKKTTETLEEAGHEKQMQ